VSGSTATIITPYTTLAAQLAGVLLAGIGLARAVRGLKPAQALATASVGLLAVVLIPTLWGAAAGDEAIRSTLVTGHGVRARELCFTANGQTASIGFARWLEARIPERADVGFEPGTVGANCLQLDLLPRRFVPASAKPAWVILARPLSAAERRDPRIQVYKPDQALERRA
jgi:hypothetical protein